MGMEEMQQTASPAVVATVIGSNAFWLGSCIVGLQLVGNWGQVHGACNMHVEVHDKEVQLQEPGLLSQQLEGAGMTRPSFFRGPNNGAVWRGVLPLATHPSTSSGSSQGPQRDRATEPEATCEHLPKHQRVESPHHVERPQPEAMSQSQTTPKRPKATVPKPRSNSRQKAPGAHTISVEQLEIGKWYVSRKTSHTRSKCAGRFSQHAGACYDEDGDTTGQGEASYIPTNALCLVTKLHRWNPATQKYLTEKMFFCGARSCLLNFNSKMLFDNKVDNAHVHGMS